METGPDFKDRVPRLRCWTVSWARPHPHISFSKIHFNIIPLMLCLGVFEIAYSVEWLTRSWMVCGAIHGELDFSCRPDRPRGPPKSSAHWAWIFSTCKDAGAWVWSTGCECAGAIPLSHRCAWVVVMRWPLPFIYAWVSIMASYLQVFSIKMSVFLKLLLHVFSNFPCMFQRCSILEINNVVKYNFLLLSACRPSMHVACPAYHILATWSPNIMPSPCLLHKQILFPVNIFVLFC